MRCSARLRHAHRLNLGVAAVRIVDAEIIKLDLDQLASDLGRGVETQRVGADKEAFRLGKFAFLRAVRGELAISSWMTARLSIARSFLVAVPPKNRPALGNG